MENNIIDIFYIKMVKRCSKCLEIRPLDEFSNKQASSDGKQNNCKECNKTYRKENKQELIIKGWIRQGIKYFDFEELYNIYSNTITCNFCNIQFGNSGKSKKCLDHQHGKSGCPRFIVCSSCNIKLRRIDGLKKDVLLDIHRYYFMK